MKILLLIIALALATLVGSAQSPQTFKYQALVRDDAGNILSNSDISLRISIISRGEDGEAVYAETQHIKSNIYGLINLIIGEGDVTKGIFKDISWGDNQYSIKLEMDIDGGDNFKEMGTSQLYAVPYALYAEKAGSVIESGSSSGSSSSSRGVRKSVGGGDRNGTPNTKFPASGNSYANVNDGNLGVGTSAPSEKLDVVGKIMSSAGYNTNGDDGLSDTVNLITNIDFTSMKLRYRTLAFNGGILTIVSDTSAWVDSVGTHLGMNKDFMCGDNFYDTRDGKQYKTVLIGTQCWFAENLNIGEKIDSALNMTNNSMIEKYCYKNEEDSCTVYGGLYQWDEAMDWTTGGGTQGICPEGWYIPTDFDWFTLETFLGGNAVAGGKLKENGYAHWWSPNSGATNSSGFTGLPGGFRYFDPPVFSAINDRAYIWSSSEAPDPSASWRILIGYNFEYSSRLASFKTNGFSVRCLKN